MHSERDLKLLERTEEIFRANIYNADDNFQWSPYRCISPGMGSFTGIWNWDSAFHAVGAARIDTELAKENILGFFRFQKEDGFLPDCIWEEGGMVETLSKPPVFAWASEIVYKADNDIEFLEEIYPKLKRNIQWWYAKRCFDGMFFYDAENKMSEDYILSVKYESGWDNAVRWDSGITNYWAIDLNCFMVMFLRSMKFIAAEIGLDEESLQWDEKEKMLASHINERCWDSGNKFYGDTDKFTGEVSKVLSPANFMPLYVGIADNERAEHMKEIAENNFKGKMPTVSFDNPEYSNDYWRGPTWLNVAYFAAKGLKNYGFAVADKIRENILDMCYNEKRGIYENYDSVTGKGLCCDHFSWSCVFIREFILNWA